MPLISELIIKSFTYVASALVEFFAKVFRFLLALPSNFLKLKIAVDRIIRDAMKASSTKKVLLLVFFGIGLRLIVKWRVDRLKKDSNR